MLSDLINISLSNRFLVIVIFLLMAIGGVYSALQIPIEVAMGGLPRVQQMRSTSKFGISSVTLVFEEGTDIYRARPLVTERMSRAQTQLLPGHGSPELGPL